MTLHRNSFFTSRPDEAIGRKKGAGQTEMHACPAQLNRQPCIAHVQPFNASPTGTTGKALSTRPRR